LALGGAALFYGDSMITPAISVLSAVEGLGIATPVLNRFVLPLTIIVLLALFLLQNGGTGCVRFGGGRRIERIEVVEIRYGAPD
jgi:KUP system potassium uptake protein